MAHDAPSGSEFRPYISPNQDIPEFTLKAVLLGIFFGVLFGAATVNRRILVVQAVPAAVALAAWLVAGPSA